VDYGITSALLELYTSKRHRFAAAALRLCAAFCATSLWAAPVIENNGSNPRVSFSELIGDLQADDSEATTVKVFWGLSDGGTTQDNWANTNEMASGQNIGIYTNNTTTNLIYGLTYYYRYFASNSVGAAWSSSSDTFTSYRQNIGTNGLMHHGYHTGPNGVMYLDSNNASGMMGGGDPTQGPTYNASALLTDGPGSRGLDFDSDADFMADGVIGQTDNYSSLFLGYFKAPEDGTYDFQNAGDDDRAGIWLDLDQDGVFESTAGGLQSDDGEQLSWESTSWYGASLTSGELYRVAFTHSEGGGGSRCDFRFRGPGVTGSPIIKPSDAGQADMWLYDIEQPLLFSLQNTGVTNVQPGTAWLNATLTSEDQRYDVYVYWHTTDYGTNITDWITNGSNAWVGAYTNLSDQILTFQATGLDSNVTYYYTFHASNDVESIVATPSDSFTPFGVPVLTATGETFADIGLRANLNASLTEGGLADTWFVWGRSNPGTTDTSLWEHVVGVGEQTSLDDFVYMATGLTYGVTYYYACYATNIAGTAWSSVDSWIIGKGTFVPGALRHYGFHAYDLTHLNLNNNGGMLNNNDPTNHPDYYAQSLLTTGPGNRGLDFDSDTDFFNTGSIGVSDNYESLFLGYLYAAVDGVYEFRRADDDDRAGIWLDLDQDRIFESAPTGLGSDRNEQLQWDGDSATKSKTLTKGYYRFAAIHGEGGGNSRVDIRFKSPTMGSEATIKPSGDAGQAGNWFYESELNVGITNSGVSNIVIGQADLTGTLFAEEAEYQVWVYWSTNNGGTSKAAWLADGSVQYMDGFTNLASTTLVHQITGLPNSTTYYYNFYASNVAEEIWGDPYLFGSAGAPTVENTGGAIVDLGTATLQGSLTAGGTADVYVAWGTTDGGTTQSAWDNWVNIGPQQVGVLFSNVAVNVYYGQTFYYRTFATNDWGTDWADSTVSFSTLRPDARVATLPVTNNLEVWYSADYGVSTNGSGVVTSWTDQSGQDRDLIPFTGSPTLETNQINDLPAVSFDASDENLQMADTNNIFFAKETWLVFRSGYGTLFGPDWGSPFGVKNGNDADRMWMFRGSENRFWSSELPDAVNHNGDTISSSGEFDMGARSMGDYMILRVVAGTANGTHAREHIVGTRMDGWANARFDTAEIIAFSATNTLAGQDDIGAYLEWKYNISSTYSDTFNPPNGSTISNTFVSGVQPGQATLNAYVESTNAIYHLDVFWSTNDYGTNAAAWLADGSSAAAGIITNENRAVSYSVPSGLINDTLYYYSFRGTNESDEIWGDPSVSFSTVGPPAVTNTGATDISIGTANLNGQLTEGGSADIYMVYGEGDAGTNSLSDWESTIDLGAFIEGYSLSATASNLYFGIGYNYRLFASNSLGTAWSTASYFTTLLPEATSEDSGWSYTNWTGDGDSGITNDFIYTAAHAFGDNNGGSITVNGVTFQEDFSRSGTGWTVTGVGNNLAGDDDVTVTGNSEQLAQEFIYQGNPALIQLSGLTSGVVYRTTFFSAGWEASGRWQTFVNDASTDSIYLDQDTYGNNNGITISYVFEATGPTESYTITPDGNTFHIYAIANREAASGTLVVISNTAALNISGNSADLGGTLYSTGSVFTAYAYWSTNNNADLSAWLADGDAQNVLIGRYTNVTMQSISGPATGLTPGTEYYYTMIATNVSTNIWASPNESFTTLDTPYVTISTGATAVSETSATLLGLLTNGSLAEASIYWGPNDGGTIAADWANVVNIGTVTQGTEFSTLLTTLATNVTYWYRSYVTNSEGHNWSYYANSFSGTPVNDSDTFAGETGLYYGEVAGDSNDTTPNPRTLIETNISTRTENSIATTTTEIYTGYIYDSDGQISFTEHNDDKARIWIDGNLVLSNDVWGTRSSTTNLNLSPGWHSIEIRISNGTGGAGPVSTPGIGYDPDGGTTWQTFQGPYDGSFLNTTNLVFIIANFAPTTISTNQATANAQLSAAITNYQVHAFWGTSDGGTNAGDWTQSSFVGGWTNIASTNISMVLSNLVQNTSYWYTFRATNQTDEVWAEPSWNFHTMPYTPRRGTMFEFK
jgi:hypothetical protein